MNIHSVGQYLGLLAAAAAFEFAYVRWAHYAARGVPGRATAYSVAVAGLGLLGLRGALTLPSGWVCYLAGIAAGSYAAAYLGRSGTVLTST